VGGEENIGKISLTTTRRERTEYLGGKREEVPADETVKRARPINRELTLRVDILPRVKEEKKRNGKRGDRKT